MMQHTCSTAAPRAASRHRPPDGRRVTLGTLILAAASASYLASMSGCDSAPASSAFAGTATDRAVETRLGQPEAMAPLQPFDEGFGAATTLR